MATVDNTQLEALVKDLEVKEQALADAKASDDDAQAKMKSATDAAAATAAAVAVAKGDLNTSADALTACVNALKS